MRTDDAQFALAKRCAQLGGVRVAKRLLGRRNLEDYRMQPAEIPAVRLPRVVLYTLLHIRECWQAEVSSNATKRIVRYLLHIVVESGGDDILSPRMLSVTRPSRYRA